MVLFRTLLEYEIAHIDGIQGSSTKKSHLLLQFRQFHLQLSNAKTLNIPASNFNDKGHFIHLKFICFE